MGFKVAKGGARPGAGRKPGGSNTKSREIADRAAAQGITPIEVMLDAMREAHEAGDSRQAALFAQMAAPYIHPKLSTINANLSGEVKASVQILSEFPDE